MISEEIIKIASNTTNVGLKKKYSHKISLKNSICGDKITLGIIVGKKKVIFSFKNELRNTSTKEIPTKKDPKYKLLCRLSFEGFNKFNVLIIFLRLRF